MSEKSHHVRSERLKILPLIGGKRERPTPFILVGPDFNSAY